MSLSGSVQLLPVQPITPEVFEPYGQFIVATDDGKPYDASDAQLCLNNGTPRFYIMRLHHRGRSFSKITRHHQCTQCLGALDGKAWLIAVAPPSKGEHPNCEQIQAFQVPGSGFIKLNLGTWHAGPFFDDPFVDFYNLELSDTNIADHDTCDLRVEYGLEFKIV
ncbi:MAG: ureidoglycolate lyase [Elainellaceae cyanobacterium]